MFLVGFGVSHLEKSILQEVKVLQFFEVIWMEVCVPGHWPQKGLVLTRSVPLNHIWLLIFL